MPRATATTSAHGGKDQNLRVVLPPLTTERRFSCLAMRRFHHVLAAVLLLGVGPTALRAQDCDTRTLFRFEDEWAGALVRRDTTTLRRLLAPGFVYTEDDRITDRDAVLRDIAAGPDTVEAARNEEMRVHCFRTTTAVTGWLIVRGRGARGPFERRYRFTDTWVFRGGRWQVVAAQDYVLYPTQAQPVESAGFWDHYGKDTILALLGVVLGSIVSFYGTMLFERYKRFREILLDISQARQMNDAYPTGIKNLEPVYLRAIDYWRTIGRKRWTLHADGHHEAAAQVGRLESFAYRSALCIEHLVNNDTLGLSPNNYLSAYQTEFNKIVREEKFVAFERQLHPNIGALLRPYPHPYSPLKATAIVGLTFFSDLLR